MIATQIVRGILLTFYYNAGLEAWNSIVRIRREVNLGNFLNLIHGNNASFIFIVLYLHIARGLLQASFYLKGVWLRGFVIILLTIAAAFLGYVLPWGQISLWGATVIINLLRVLPYGKALVVWIWGGFYVSEYTCTLFFGLHYLVPFIVAVVAIAHIIFLHKYGRSSPTGISLSNILKVKFRPFFIYKDILNLLFIIVILLVLLAFPYWAGDPENFLEADLTNSPLHIQPEWYFLQYYAILRRIPSKSGGILAFLFSIVGLALISLSFTIYKINNYLFYPFVIYSFFSINILLIWLGSQPVEDPFILIRQLLRVAYFGVLFYIFFKDKILCLLE